MIFTYDPVKNASNLRKHGISFNTASKAFSDRNCVVRYDQEHSITEDRFILTGLADDILLTVIFTLINDNTIRIISARKATKVEEELYN